MEGVAMQAKRGGGAPPPPGSKRGLILVLAGVACEVLGFVLLSQGSMTAAPALLIGSFGVMGLGIWQGWD
jgi:hypothetical protein